MIRLVIADDQASIRLALESNLKSYSDLQVVGFAENGRQAVAQVAQLSPDVILLDLEMPLLDGLGAAHEIQEHFPNTKILVLTSQDNPQSLLSALRAGIHGYLLKNTPAEDLANAIRSVQKGHFQIGPGIVAPSVPEPTPQAQAVGSSASTMMVAPKGTLLMEDPPSANGLVTAATAALAVKPIAVKPAPFDRPVILQRSPLWSRVIIWGIMTSTAGIVAWACLAKIDSAVLATGQLVPQGAVKEVQPPVSGVVKEIFVRDGQRVKKGDTLLTLDPKGTQAELSALRRVRQTLLDENAFYQQQTQHARGVLQSPVASDRIPSQMRSLADSREALIKETQLYRAQIYGNGASIGLTPEQQMRLQSNLREESSRAGAAQLEIAQLQKQVLQNQIQLESSQKTIAVYQGLVSDITPAVEAGAVARVELLKQQEALQKAQADMAKYEQENARLAVLINQAQAKVDNTVSLSRKDLLSAIANNEKQIAEIDSQFTKAILDNEKQIAETDNKLSQAQFTLRYQELQAPTDGVVFELKAHAPGYVANTNATEPILKLVPSEILLAKVYITNKDIGFIRTGMPVDVRIDSFPLSEFGDIKGELTWVGSDALEPTQERQYYSFPAKIKLDSQKLKSNGQSLTLQSGMSISANIKTRQRTVISLFTDLFTGEVENLKHLR
jgi:hemolysin D